MLTRIAVAVSVLCLVLPAATFAQGFSQGDKEVTLGGSGLSTNDFDYTVFRASGSLGYFFTSNLEASVRQTLDLSASDWSAETAVAGDYHFDMGRFWPFVGGAINVHYGDGETDTWYGGVEGGAKFFVNETTFIEGMVGYGWTFTDCEDKPDAILSYLLGIGFRF